MPEPGPLPGPRGPRKQHQPLKMGPSCPWMHPVAEAFAGLFRTSLLGPARCPEGQDRRPASWVTWVVATPSLWGRSQELGPAWSRTRCQLGEQLRTHNDTVTWREGQRVLLGDAGAVPALASRALAAGPAWALGAQTQEASGAWSAPPHTHTEPAQGACPAGGRGRLDA